MKPCCSPEPRIPSSQPEHLAVEAAADQARYAPGLEQDLKNAAGHEMRKCCQSLNESMSDGKKLTKRTGGVLPLVGATPDSAGLGHCTSTPAAGRQGPVLQRC